MKTRKNNIVVIGAGPSGLGCGYELCRNKITSVNILDKNDRVGGLARSFKFHNRYYDIGPHRFYTQNKEVLDLWKKILGKNLIQVPRLTRSLYKNKLFLYPVVFKDALFKLGIGDSVKSLLSFLRAKIFIRNLYTKTFEQYIVKNFGSKLYSIIFKTYTEKIWGIPCSRIGSEWAAQRIKNVNFVSVLKNALFGKKSAKSWIDRFLYPKQGAGQMYETIAKGIEKSGQKIELGAKIVSIKHHDGRITKIEYEKNGKKYNNIVDYCFSSMPLTQFIRSLDPLPPKKVIDASKKLYYRDHITVNMVVKGSELFPDNWIYVYSPEVKMARVTNYNNFTNHQSLVTNHQSAIAVEYFVFKNDSLWKKTDEELVELAKQELENVRLADNKRVLDAFVIRETESYPTYYMGYKPYLDKIKRYVSRFKNLQLIGRGGMYKYNNMDHAMYSGMLAARNYVAGKQMYDVWSINEDAEYLEK